MYDQSSDEQQKTMTIKKLALDLHARKIYETTKSMSPISQG